MRWIVPMLLAVVLGGCGSGTGSKIAWASSLEAAKTKAAASNSLVMLKFYADW